MRTVVYVGGILMFNSNTLPDIMYFGAPKEIPQLTKRVFLTPHAGIASLFVIDAEDLFPKGYSVNGNIFYDQWEY